MSSLNPIPPPYPSHFHERKNRKQAKNIEQAAIETTIDNALAGYICPITRELPVDPVLAEDGRVYERNAIEHLMKAQQGKFRSPVTNDHMGGNLEPATNHLEQIRTLVQLITSEGGTGHKQAATWNDKREAFDFVEETRRKAEAGDSDKMVNLGRWYFKGGRGLKKDREVGYNWLKKSSDLHNVRGMAWTGMCLMNGIGTKKNETHGMNLITLAACRGSEYAAQCLGKWYKNGDFGLPKSTSEAKYWLLQIVDEKCVVKDLTGVGREEVAKLMKEIDLLSEGTDAANGE